MQGRQDRGQSLVLETGRGRARHLLDGLIAYRAELGELGRELEALLRAAGVTPSSRATEFLQDNSLGHADRTP
ncbi:hypothetical protein B1C78_16585 [Thioalkalivibrio denitrificans]|uniref:Uncharacterized protein n=1 Tax=Thioalkalivibrio denitrificans TaxID=108003 RepID=A0A1V3N877_9GAMM|nr:hypothetical protein [Thioalkalivibrio denitrificans]OOG21201.1 hypothetical protein B1C78_16585 [Thioalkalivibrio denitrificans]